MIPISIKFQAYIPKNLGKPLLSYFENDTRLNCLINKDIFLKKLSDIDKGSNGYWIPEPLSNSYYFSTDDTYIHNHHTEHTMRLGFHLNIDPDKIGRYKSSDSFLLHKKHKDETVNNNQQHSGLSHRVEAYITKYQNKYYYSYAGVCKKWSSRRSPEEPLCIKVKKPFSLMKEPITIFEIGASADYPFTFSPLTPNIDFKMDIKITRISKDFVRIEIDGKHNEFPAYELIINEKVVYLYNPIEHGKTGPNPWNLFWSEDINVCRIVKIH